MLMGKTPFVDFPGEQDLRKLFLRICKTQYKPVEFDPAFDDNAAIEGVEGEACRNMYVDRHSNACSILTNPKPQP